MKMLEVSLPISVRLQKRELIHIGIAIDVVILAAGVAMLYPAPEVLFIAFSATAALSTWKGGWRGAWTSILFAALVEGAMFGDLLSAAQIGLIATAALAIAYGVQSVRTFHPLPAEVIEARRAAAEKRRAEMRETRAARIAENRAARERDVAEKAEKAAKPKPKSKRAATPILKALPPSRENARTTRDASPHMLAKKREPKPRILFYERRRATADLAVAKLKMQGVEAEVVERLIDAADEIFRFRPNALFIDSELPAFEKDYRTLTNQNQDLPIFLTGRAMQTVSSVRYVDFVVRPYDVDALAAIAQRAKSNRDDLLAQQKVDRTPPPKPEAPRAAPRVVSPEAEQREGSGYDATCFSCRAVFDAMEADWCSCLTKERTLVCTNCLICFCKAPASYKEKFWVGAPPALFDRKATDAKRAAALPPNPSPQDVARPLVLSVEDDEEIQRIVQRVCTNIGYGFVYALNGSDGLELANLYRPNLVLSDAFMPKLDGREMCRMLKEDPSFADCKMIVMTGLYTDTKYRSEALKRFHIDDYLSKPVAITELIQILQRHLDGITAPVIVDEPMTEEAGDNESVGEEFVQTETEEIAADDDVKDRYDVCCFNCSRLFDATMAEWCNCVGRDNTLVCPFCHGCFCKAPPDYRERFWIDAPSSVFERKMLGSKRHITVRSNPAPDEVKRPLILLVEDDENVQLIVRTVVTSMGFGFVAGANGQEGLTLARDYTPDLILSDAFMPKLDGREMCRLLKLDPTTERTKTIIMTGLYTDRKYRNEALDYFKVDDYVAKPLAVDDLIKLFKKHLPQEVQPAM